MLVVDALALHEVASFGPYISPAQASGHDLPGLWVGVWTTDFGRSRFSRFSISILWASTRTPAANPLVVSGDAGSLLPMGTADC